MEQRKGYDAMRVLRVSFEVTEDRAGGVLADLADKVENLSFGLVVPLPHGKNRPRVSRSSDQGPGAEVLLDAMREAGRPLSSSECATVWSGLGYKSRTGMYDTLRRLIRSKQVRRRGNLRSRGSSYEVTR